MNDLCDYIENLLNILELNEKGLSNLLNLLIQSNKEYTLKEIAELLIFSEKKTYRLVNKLEKLKLIKKSGFPMKISINPNYNDVFINIINEFIKKSKNEIYKKQELLNNLVEIIQKTPLETKIPNELELMKTKNDWTLYIPQNLIYCRSCVDSADDIWFDYCHSRVQLLLVEFILSIYEIFHYFLSFSKDD